MALVFGVVLGKECTFKAKARTKDLTLKAKDRTKDRNLVLKDNQGPRPRTTSMIILAFVNVRLK